MTFVSYARDFEDVLLWRVFRDEAPGFYVDIGAEHPDEGSVTRAFHDRLWRGINIVSPEHLAWFAGARPRDINLAPPSAGVADLCRRHAPPEFGFLRIAPGLAREVLEGADFTGFRPRVVVIGEDEPVGERMLGAGYVGAIRGFHVAREHAALCARFAEPLGENDDFMRAPAAGSALNHVERARVERALAAERLRAARAAAHEQLASARLAEQRTAARADSERARQWHQHATDLSRYIEALHRSTSWRVTAPLRGAKLTFDALRGRDTAGTPAAPVFASPVAEDPGPVPIVPTAEPGRGIRAVHQFHSGSATGDAITNAMFLTQAWLRRLGYRSEIYVDHRDPGLADRLFTIDDLPEHSDYVLIVRHSMGHDACARILALPAPKILLYHNITPPEFLEDAPVFQRYARLGRRQLDQLRPHMRAALADSEYNSLELRRHGYDQPGVCTFLFDIEAMAASPVRQTEHPFTILFVGRIVGSKGQAELVDAFAAFRRDFGKPCRLVLVGRTEDASRYDAEVRARIAAHALEGAVLLTGAVSDAERDRWYAEADLYVSLSRHEGFGVPLVEAMANDLPVIAWPAGAVPYTMGGTGVLLTERTPEAMAASLLRLATDPTLRSSIAARQRQALKRFRLERQIPALIQALVAAGAAAPGDAERRRALKRNLRFAVAGHVLGTYSLAITNRLMALSLEAARPGSVRFLPIEGEPIRDLSPVPAPHAASISALVSRPPPPSGPEVAICQHYPIRTPGFAADAALAVVAWEESLLPAAMVERLNRGFQGVLAPSSFAAKALIDSGVALPVWTVGYGFDLGAFRRVGRKARDRARLGGVHLPACLLLLSAQRCRCAARGLGARCSGAAIRCGW